MRFPCFRPYPIPNTLGYYQQDHQNAPRSIHGSSPRWLDYSPPRQDCWNHALLASALQALHQTTYPRPPRSHCTSFLVLFPGCLQSPGTKVAVWSECLRKSTLCYVPTYENPRLLQRHVNRCSFLSLSNVKLPAPQEKDICDRISPQSDTRSDTTTTATTTIRGISTPVKASPYPKADRVVDCEICHLYSLKHLIEEDFVDVYYYNDLYTCLGCQLYTKIAWIQDYCSEIYYSMNEAKRDRHHPVWSNVHARFKRNRPFWSIPQYYAWLEVISKPYIPTWRLPPDTSFGLDYMKPIILFVALIKIDDRYGDGWHELIFEDRFGDGWHD